MKGAESQETVTACRMESGNYAYIIKCKGMSDKSKVPEPDLFGGAILPLVQAVTPSELFNFTVCLSPMDPLQGNIDCGHFLLLCQMLGVSVMDPLSD